MSRQIGRHRSRGRHWLLALVAVGGLFAIPAPSRAQDDEKPPEPENVTIETKDLVQLRCTWYAGTGKKVSVPVIMLHDWDGSRFEYDGIARALQAKGHSVIVPDLRGHGESTRQTGIADALDREKFNQTQVALIAEDIEACKRFLLKKNDDGELNIEMLTLVVAGKITPIAVAWALKDWEWPPIAGRKQGKDVKALVLLSPEQSFKRISMKALMRNPLLCGARGFEPLSVMVAVGTENNTYAREARTLDQLLAKNRGEPESLETQNLFLVEFPVEYQGTALVHPQAPAAGVDMYRQIESFLDYRLMKRSDQFPWQDRSPPS